MHRAAMRAAGESQLQDRASLPQVPLAKRPIVEAALAFVAGLATFALVSIVVAAIEHDGPVLLLAIPSIGAIIVVARRWGAAYAVPVAMASILAYDWYYVPPTHGHEFPDAANLADLGVYIALGVLVGQIVSRAGHRARVSDVRRGELAEERAALRRVATLVARGVSPSEVFAAVARELGHVLDVEATHIGRYESDGTVMGIAGWSASGDHLPPGTRASSEGESVTAVVRRTGRPARLDSYDDVEGEIAAQLRNRHVRSSVGAPIVVDGHIWGVTIASSKRDDPLPPDTETRIDAFTELLATTISSAEARTEVERLADEQAALRRVATLVAEDAPQSQLFDAVGCEAGMLLGADFSGMARFEGTDVIPVASWAAEGEHPHFPERWEMQPGDPATAVAEARRPIRWDDWGATPGPLAAYIRDEVGARSTVGCPIIVEGRVWGAFAIHSKRHEPLPADTESRLEQFAELVATAVANSDARTEVARLADEQAALRRVATLVAQDAPADELFDAVAHEAADLVACDTAAIVRFAGDGTATVVGGFHARRPLGIPFTPDPGYVIVAVRTTGRAARFDTDDPSAADMPEAARAEGIRSGLASPIVVDGALWGTITVASLSRPLPSRTERRLADFTELVGTAISNAQAREAHRVLADEQAALRRVATLVAQGVPSEALFSAVCDEVQALAGTDACVVVRFEAKGTVTVMGTNADRHPTDARLELDPDYVVAEVHRTGRAARFDTDDPAAPGMPEIVRAERIRCGVASPIVVEGELWGAITSASRERPLAAGMERRLADFTELVATAIANLQARAELAASRARIAAAADDERRRVVRDLHDGAQQRLVHTVITLKLAQQALAKGAENGPLLVQEAIAHAERATAEVRELAHGILPSVLMHGGLRAGIDALGLRTSVPVEIDVSVDRLPAPVEAGAYFVVAEALTNVAKHSSAGHAEVVVRIEDGMLRVEVRDDGLGGASPEGSGLVGLADRVAVLDGRLEVDSPSGGGTRLTAAIPLPPSGRSASA